MLTPGANAHAWSRRLVVGLAWLVAMLTPALALKIELKDAAPDRIERQRQVARGETLPGTPEVSATENRLEKLDLKVGKPVMPADLQGRIRA